MESQELFAILCAASIEPLHDAAEPFHLMQTNMLQYPPPRKSWKADAGDKAAGLTDMRKSVARSVGLDILKFESGSWGMHKS